MHLWFRDGLDVRKLRHERGHVKVLLSRGLAGRRVLSENVLNRLKLQLLLRLIQVTLLLLLMLLLLLRLRLRLLVLRLHLK